MKKAILFLLVAVLALEVAAQEKVDPKTIVEKSYELTLGKSSFNVTTMNVVRPQWSRSVSMQAWSVGQDYYLIYITDPAKEKGEVFLKRENEMWNWVPSINRTIKIPPSLMGQSWLGSDFTNRDLVKQKSIITDYTHEIIGSKTIDGYDCYQVKLIPLDNAPVVWGQIMLYITKKGFMTLQADYFDDQLKLVKQQKGSEIKTIDGRTLPTLLTMIPVDKKGYMTTLKFDQLKFDDPSIRLDFFSIQNMKQVKPQ